MEASRTLSLRDIRAEIRSSGVLVHGEKLSSIHASWQKHSADSEKGGDPLDSLVDAISTLEDLKTSFAHLYQFYRAFTLEEEASTFLYNSLVDYRRIYLQYRNIILAEKDKCRQREGVTEEQLGPELSPMDVSLSVFTPIAGAKTTQPSTVTSLPSIPFSLPSSSSTTAAPDSDLAPPLITTSEVENLTLGSQRDFTQVVEESGGGGGGGGVEGGGRSRMEDGVRLGDDGQSSIGSGASTTASAQIRRSQAAAAAAAVKASHAKEMKRKRLETKRFLLQQQHKLQLLELEAEEDDKIAEADAALEAENAALNVLTSDTGEISMQNLPLVPEMTSQERISHYLGESYLPLPLSNQPRSTAATSSRPSAEAPVTFTSATSLPYLTTLVANPAALHPVLSSTSGLPSSNLLRQVGSHAVVASTAVSNFITKPPIIPPSALRACTNTHVASQHNTPIPSVTFSQANRLSTSLIPNPTATPFQSSPMNVRNTIPPQHSISHISNNSLASDAMEALVGNQKVSQNRPSEERRWKGDAFTLHEFLSNFENDVENVAGVDDRTKLNELFKWVKGPAYEAIRAVNLLGNPTLALVTAKSKLNEIWGMQQRTSSDLLSKILQDGKIDSKDSASIWSLVSNLEHTYLIAEKSGDVSQLTSLESMRKIVVNRVPFLQYKWADHTHKLVHKQSVQVSFYHFVEFLKDFATKLSGPFGASVMAAVEDENKKKSSADTDKAKFEKKADFKKSFSSAGIDTKSTTNSGTELTPNSDTESSSYSDSKSSSSVGYPTCHFCSKSHSIYRCFEFKKLSVPERIQIVRKRGLCLQLCNEKHLLRDCKTNFKCGVCDNRNHHTLLHIARPDENKSKDESTFVKSVNSSSSATSEASNACTMTGKGGRWRPICALRVTNPENGISVDTYAILDQGSDRTCVKRNLVAALSGKTYKSDLNVGTFEKEPSPEIKDCLTIDLHSLYNESYCMDNVSAVVGNYLPVGKHTIALQTDANSHPHLNDVEVIELPVSKREVCVLIGTDIGNSLLPLEDGVRRGTRSTPGAFLSEWGWALIGPCVSGPSDSFSSAFLQMHSADNDVLNRQMDLMMSRDFNDSPYDKDGMSVDDREAMKVIEESCHFVDGQYETGLPWRYPRELIAEILPTEESDRQARRRTEKMGHRLRQDPEKFAMVRTQIENFKNKGYAEIVPIKELEQSPEVPVLTLPPVLATHPHKPGKIRFCHDCRAPFNGISLNSLLHTGADLLNNSSGCLIRARQEPVFFMSDIEDFFLKVRVSKEDINALRFYFWKENDMNQELEVLRMLVHLFGGTSSPTVSNHALHKTADDNARDFSAEAVQTIKRNFFMDDCLKSCPDDEQAIKLIKELIALVARGGFKLGKWISNSRAVLQSVPADLISEKVKDFESEDLPIERALGLKLDIESDSFVFKTKALKAGEEEEEVKTRRKALSVTLTVFDPMGLISPFILKAKLLVQKFCAFRLGWDEPIPKLEAELFAEWRKSLPLLERLKISRCYKSKQLGKIVKIQLHFFSDASAEAYGAVAYLRFLYEAGGIHVCLIMSKSRVAPLKPITIPKLELQAATISIELAIFLIQELEYEIDEMVFWVDATCVLRQVYNTTTRFPAYVANRLKKIHDVTSPSQWRHVPTEMNPGDLCSRGLDAADEAGWHFFLNGPEFLSKPSSFWPPNILEDEEGREEEQPVEIFGIESQPETHFIDSFSEHFSSFYALKKAFVWLSRFKQYSICKFLKSRQDLEMPKASLVSATELKSAESEIIRLIQEKSFCKEMKFLVAQDAAARSPEKHQVLHKTVSSLRALDPFVKDGFLRVGGRLKHADIPFEAKPPLVLPQHHATALLVRQIHREQGHSGVEHVHNCIRQSFWILKGRAFVKKEIGKCFQCRKLFAKPASQKMGNLPKYRLEPSYAFHTVGVDYAGPFYTKVGRNTRKRYICLFTCVATRAIHLEVANELTSSCFILCLQRFCARRPGVRKMLSDCGTNFVGAERELKKRFAEWNNECALDMRKKAIVWSFNPPAAPHAGGLWERMVRSTKRILKSIVDSRVPSDQVFITLVVVAEGIINQRPLTRVSNDPNDLRAITPAMIVSPGTPASSSSDVLPPSPFSEASLHRIHDQSRDLCDSFWRRWSRDYLSTLQTRQKWFNPQRNFVIGDLVLMTSELHPRDSWPLATVVNTYPDSNGQIRRLRVRTRVRKRLQQNRSP